MCMGYFNGCYNGCLMVAMEVLRWVLDVAENVLRDDRDVVEYMAMRKCKSVTSLWRKTNAGDCQVQRKSLSSNRLFSQQSQYYGVWDGGMR